MRSPFRHVLVMAAISLVAAGCAPHGTTGASAVASHNSITAAELARAGDVSLYEALRQLRPNFLRSHGTVGVQNPGPLQVFVGTEEMEGVDHLRQIAARAVKEVTYLEPQQANARFGGNHAGGALVVTLM